MSVRTYLDRTALLSLGATIGKTPNGVYEEIRLNGFKISPGNGDPFLDFSCPIELFEPPSNSELPPLAIKGYGCHDNICPGFTPRRQVGVYRLRTATAVLTDSAKTHYHLQLKASSLEDMKLLHTLICQGKIWPERDYQAEMVPPPYRHVRALLRELWEVIRRDVSQKFYRA